ncbi:MAG: Fur family transcriptional regulator [Ruminococcus sp.]|nr:Fur family transcriptional regulator [Ruminococcus sp.]
MPKYMTKQRRVFLDFLSKHSDEQLSVKQIAQALEDENISLSAVYRNLSALEEDGKIRRVSKSGSREVYYQYIGDEHCRDCLHLSCEKCGKTFHMGVSGADMLIKNVALAEEFAVDKSNTVLYGICKACQKK